MSSEKNIQKATETTTTARAENPPALMKKIGQTTYIVRIHFYIFEKRKKISFHFK